MQRITINEDADFLITDEVGNVPSGGELGFYHEDTRFLSDYRLTLDGQLPIVLAARATHFSRASHYLVNPTFPHIARGAIGIIRHQQINQGLHEEIIVTNYSHQLISLPLEIACDADFGHLFEVKHEIEISRDRAQRGGVARRLVEDGGNVLRCTFTRDGVERQLEVTLSHSPEIVDTSWRFLLKLQPKEEWTLRLTFRALTSLEKSLPGMERDAYYMTVARERQQQQRAAILQTATIVTSDSLVLQQAYQQALNDIASLLMEDPNAHDSEFIIAAGIPWFMTLFGRDSLITALQILPLYPEVAKGVVRALARLQGTKVDVVRVEEPGKILHEYRSSVFSGTANSAAVFPYYGTIDATPLFIMLLGAILRVTGDVHFITEQRAAMEQALHWMDVYGDRDGDGYLEYQREAAVGLINQGWKDSGDAICYRDGTQAPAPIALCEVQGYAYSARLHAADIYDALHESSLAQIQREQAIQLRRNFNRDFWIEERQCFALALDAHKHHVDAVTSNAGQLLWCGIVADEYAAPLVHTLMSPALFSGWGIRTMSMADGAYNPISYHNGSVWPHDNSIILAGLARYGFIAEASQLVDALLDTISAFADMRFPELFGGFQRDEASFPVQYPTASVPQAWSSGAVILMITTMAGFNVLVPTLTAPAFLPTSVSQLRVTGLPHTADLKVERETS